MLKEIRAVSQVPGDKRRRWFASAALDLIVWVENDGSTAGFQLCYDRGRDEKALTWRAPSSFSLMTVDDGEGRAMRHKGSPILVPGADFDEARAADLFRRESGGLPEEIAALVAAKIAEFGRLSPGVSAPKTPRPAAPARGARPRRPRSGRKARR